MIPTLTAIHFLISYGCSAACDHCFLWGSPGRAGMSARQVEGWLEEIPGLGTVTGACAEGGEAFTRYPVVSHFVRRAGALGLSPSALTNAYWVRSRGVGERRMGELAAAGLTRLGVSTDQWHRRHVPERRVELLLEICARMGVEASRMETKLEGVMFRGRAAARLAGAMPAHPPEELTTCPHEKLAAPSRVHLDCYGRLHLCQGLNVGRGSLREAIAGYHPECHPIVRPLLEGGPYALARLAAQRGFVPAAGYADGCHLCYRAREFLRPIFPDLLGPDEMYGG